ncbi:response regulator [Tautonia plasticadhaerens]|uniref:Response regulator receiver protein n=1 Tax=Tautonia plasticadhaerens TaxID=2527974 RepID=A0A518H7M2_9BACT|nr:response regulator [Tautonia plasticadhaerens]QDV36842.1 Response regulator receiver protein [Tautonia plasticadhaerens]
MSEPPPNILLVDDDVDACRNVSDILGDLGYRVDVAHDGPAALELARGRPYDVAVLDFRMPGMDGVTLSRHLRRHNPGTVALMLTAYASHDTAEAARTAGTWRVLRKPVDIPALLGLIGEAVGQPLVLVVDDDQDLCENLRDLLRSRDFRVCTAHDPREAASRLAEARFRAVLIDMKLPGGDGHSVFRAVRSTDPDARTVLITGNRPETDPMITEALSEGADAVCYKPLDPPELLALLERLVGACPPQSR